MCSGVCVLGWVALGVVPDLCKHTQEVAVKYNDPKQAEFRTMFDHYKKLLVDAAREGLINLADDHDVKK